MPPRFGVCGMLTQHAGKQLHIAAGRHIPAEILGHINGLQAAEAVTVEVVQPQAALDRPKEIVGIVALEGEAQAVFAVFVHTGNGVPQAAGGMHHGHCAVTHGVHLAQAAGLALRRHQVDIAAGIDAGGQGEAEGDLGRHTVGVLVGQLTEELLVLAFARAQNEQLAILFFQKAAGAVAQQIQTLVACQAGDHNQQGRIAFCGQANLFLQGSLAGGFAVNEGICIVVGGSALSVAGLKVLVSMPLVMPVSFQAWSDKMPSRPWA